MLLYIYGHLSSLSFHSVIEYRHLVGFFLYFSPQDRSLSTHLLGSTPILLLLEDILQQEEEAFLQHHPALGIQRQEDTLLQGVTLPRGASLELPRLEECHLILEALGMVCLPPALASVAIPSLLPKAMLEVDQHKFQ